MKYLSICSGIEAASVAWEPLGWKPVGFSEIEKFPSAVLAHHWPDVPNLGDMTKHHEWPTTLQPDLIVGGTPCQAFSVAGLRQGLADPRGNLTLTFLSILEQYRPRWVVWENVPGVLSDKTGAFGAFLGGMGELGYGFAYRVLDAQYFGVPQRRRRVFVVGCLGDWQRAAAVLFESHSLQGHTPPRREAGKRTATGFETGFDGSSEPIFLDRAAFNQGENAQFDPVIRSGGVSDALVARGPHAVCTFDRQSFGEYGTAPVVSTVSTVSARDYKGPSDLIAYRTSGNCGAYETGETVDALTTGTDQTSHILAFDTTQITSKANYSNPKPNDPCHPLAAGAHAPAIAIHDMATRHQGTNGSGADVGKGHGLGIAGPEDPMFTLTKGDHHAIATNHIVRRLTPTECERLQGFPDGHTLIPVNGKPAADGPRYKALGNSMAVPCMEWLGKRIQMMENL